MPTPPFEQLLAYKDIPLHIIAQEYGFDVRPVGSSYRAHCKFCGGTGSPNLTFFPKNDTFYCFACKTTGTKSYFLYLVTSTPKHDLEYIWRTGQKPGSGALVLDLDSPEANNLRVPCMRVVAVWCGQRLATGAEYPKEILAHIDEILLREDFKQREYDLVISLLHQAEELLCLK